MTTTRRRVGAMAPYWLSTLLAGSLSASYSAAADQNSTPEQAAQGEAQSLEEVIVTGTLIRSAAPVGSSVIAVTQQDLQATGANTVADMLLDAPQVDNLGITDASRTGTGGAGNITYGNSINIRGLSPFATLTLVDGHRAPPAGTSGAFVDPNSFPSLMLQRIDIVADGASATYGSDAIAGVANLILRRDVDGVEVSAREGWASGYNEHKFGILVGHNWGSGQISIGYENNFNSALNGEERGFYQSDQATRGGTDYRTSQCNPGTIVGANGTTYAIPAGGVTPATAASLVAGTQNLCDNAKNSDILPEVNRNVVALTFDQKITDFISIYGDATYAHRDYSLAGAPPTGPLEVPTTNAYFVQPAGAALAPCSPAPGSPLCEQVNYSFGRDAGNSNNLGYSENYQGTLGIDFKLWQGWHLGFDGTTGRDNDLALDPVYGLNQAGLSAALASGTPSTALNVFGGANSSAVTKSIFDAQFVAPGYSGEQVIEGKLDGPLFHLPGGDINVAVGGQWRHDELLYGINSGVPGPTFLVLRQDLSRHSESAFAEILVPFVSKDNALPGVQSLALDIAGRYEDYSDFGRTSHPKIGLNWSPLEGVLVHASYGTSFRAPQLSELVGPLNGVFVQTYSDPLAPGGTSVGYALGGGNTKLKPETARTWSFGADFQPTEFAKFSVTYWNIDYRDQISSYLSDLTILQQAGQLGSLIDRCPSAACTALTNQYILGVGPNASPEPVFGPILANPSVFVNGLELNLGTTRTSGFDFQGNYVMPTDHFGRWSAGLSGTLFSQYLVQFVPNGAQFNELNTVGYPLKFRLRGSLGWGEGPWNAVAFVNFENSYTNTEVTPSQSVGAFTTVDLNLVYKVGEAFQSVWTRDFSVTLHVNNIFNTQPPYVDIPISPNGGGGFDPGAANPIGRLVSLGVGKKF